MSNPKYRILLFFLGVIVLASACKKDALLEDPSAILAFSADTVLFDTVFTTIGSTTQYLRVYNSNKKRINISSIKLAGGSASAFRINVDGISGNQFSDVEIPGNDSLFIFVEVTIDQSTGNLPFIVADSIVFETNGNIQDVQLVAWGQDAHFFNGSILCDMTWPNDKPYVIYNSILVDSGCTLTIDPGVLVHSHNYAGIFVKGTLLVNGASDETVVFQGDRLESFYDNIPGQWLGIFLLRGSINSIIDNAVIKNAFYGVSAGSHDNPDLNSFTEANSPNAIIKHTVIQDMMYTGIFGFLSQLEVENTLVFNCGQHNAHLAFGGNYNFTHVTLANYGNNGINHGDPVLELGNFAESAQGHFSADLTASFTNCIVDGSLDDELGYDDDTFGAFDYLFENCALKTTFSISLPDYIAIIKNQNPNFVNMGDANYQLLSGSPCIDAGKTTSITDDLVGEPRDANPDIGAFEYIP